DREKEVRYEKSPRKGRAKNGARPWTQSRPAAVFAVLAAGFSAVLTFSEIWAFTTWAGLKMDEIIFHLHAPLEGTGGGMLWKYATRCILPAVLIMLSMVFMIARLRRTPRARGTFVKRSLLGAMTALVLCLAVGTVKLDLVRYFRDQMEDSPFIEENYTDPRKTAIRFPEKKRNLIYIYLESMETTFADVENGGAFNENIIPGLTELAREGENFSGNSGLLNGGYVMPGSTYTMAGIFTQSSGLPLKVDLGEEFTDQRGSFNKMNTQDSFFSGVTTLGDVLRDEGYRQAFLLGSDATFGGRRLYLTEHGGYEIWDYKWAVEQGLIPKDYYVFWGYEDEKLFTFAREKVTEMASGEEPFHLSLLTVDTHFEDGYRCRLCRDDFEGNQYANAMACSSRQVYEFIRWVQEQDFYENTTIVLCGDHLTMDSNFCLDVPASYNRRTYTAFINAAGTPADPQRERTYTTLDCFPTTLAALGADIEGDRLGLGTNLFGTEDTLAETYGVQELSDSLSKKSSFMQKLANIDIYDSELLRLQGLAPSSSIRITDCDAAEGRLSVAVGNFKNIAEKFRSVEAQITDNDHPDRTVTIPLQKGENDVYTGGLDGTEGINLKSCRLYVYVNGKSGMRYEAGRVTGDLSLRTDDIHEYLRRLAQNPQYSIFVAIRDDGTRDVTEQIQELLNGLGLEETLHGHYRWSYYAVLIPGEEKKEEIGEEELSCTGVLPDGAEYSVISQGGLSGAGGSAGRYLTCSVKINDVEYAVQRIGLNFVVYDNEHSVVADSVEFNTYDGLYARRKEPSYQSPQ
ncbi:MAG: sulfatase-like hydrolase/transferase, partial [Eubacteriales bacterium]|nr:sulfatase-like hydrolase/transferase [Eubacteriales bacterium]